MSHIARAYAGALQARKLRPNHAEFADVLDDALDVPMGRCAGSGDAWVVAVTGFVGFE